MSRRVVWLVIVATALVGAATDLAVGEPRPGLTAALGFLGCVVLIRLSKLLGGSLLQRPEAYYAETDHPEVRDAA